MKPLALLLSLMVCVGCDVGPQPDHPAVLVAGRWKDIGYGDREEYALICSATGEDLGTIEVTVHEWFAQTHNVPYDKHPLASWYATGQEARMAVEKATADAGICVQKGKP